MKHVGICILVLLFAQVVWPGEANCADDGIKPGDEASKQEMIYQSKGKEVPSGYVIDRSLADYKETLSAGFSGVLSGLGAQDRWLDIGAGTGQAILDYCVPPTDSPQPYEPVRTAGKAQAVAISIEDRRTPRWYKTAASLEPNRIQYFFNRRLREYSPQELGKFKVVTDLIGGFSYSEDLTMFMEKVLGLLEVNGSFFTVLQDVHAEDGKNKPYYEGATYLTEIANAKGSEVTVCSWLKSIACVAVTCELKTGWKPPIETYHIRKTCNEVSVPALTQVGFQSGTPPERKYKLKN